MAEPYFVQVSPDDGAKISGNTVEIFFTVKVSGGKPSYVCVRIDNSQAIEDLQLYSSAGGYCEYKYTATIQDGKHEIEYYAEADGSSVSKTCTFRVGEPKHTVITVESPLPGSILDSSRVNFSFTVTGEKQDIDPAQVAISPYGGYGETNLDYTELNDGYRFHYGQEYENGDYTAIIHAYDYDGSNVTAEISFTVEISTTEITIESPLQDSHPAGKPVEIVFAATDSTSAISPGTGYISVDGGRPVSNLERETIADGYRFTYNAQLEYGEHTIVAGATNSAGKEKSATVTFENYAGPVATIEYPAEGQVFPHGEEIKPAFTVTDQFVSVDPSTAYIYFSGAGRPFFIADLDVERLNNGYRFTLKDGVVPDEGNHTFEVSCANYEGNTATATISFIVNNAPVITMISPAEGEIIKKKRVYVVFTATDFVPGIDPATALIYVNGHSPIGDLMYEEYGSTGYRFSKTIDAEKGENTIIVSVQDKLGTTSSKTVSFVVEPVVPKITEIRISPNPVESGQEFEIIAEVEYEEV